MSAVSGISSASPLSYLQQLQQQNRGDGFEGQAVGSALSALGVDSSKASTIESQIQQAVKSAAGTSSNPSDRRMAVQQAIAGVLKNNGIDPTQFRTQLHAAFQKLGGSRRHHQDGDSPNRSISPVLGAAGPISTTTSSGGFNAVV